jgi:ParB family chromosome partitioning protein
MPDNVVKEKFLQVDIQRIVSNRYQPRKKIDEEEIRELAESIKQVGLLHPPTVQERQGQYEIISGERRVLACKFLGHETICVIVRQHMRTCQVAQAALIENIQRVDLNPIEIAKSIKALMYEFDLSQEELSSQVGKKRSTIANYLRLLQLPERMQQALEDESLSMAHAKAILACPSIHRERLFDEVLTEGLTVRQTMNRVDVLLGKKDAPKARKKEMHSYQDVEERLQAFFGTKVRISKSHVEITYHGLDDLDRLLELVL